MGECCLYVLHVKCVHRHRKFHVLRPTNRSDQNECQCIIDKINSLCVSRSRIKGRAELFMEIMKYKLYKVVIWNNKKYTFFCIVWKCNTIFPLNCNIIVRHITHEIASVA